MIKRSVDLFSQRQRQALRCDGYTTYPTCPDVLRRSRRSHNQTGKNDASTSPLHSIEQVGTDSNNSYKAKPDTILRLNRNDGMMSQPPNSSCLSMRDTNTICLQPSNMRTAHGSRYSVTQNGPRRKLNILSNDTRTQCL